MIPVPPTILQRYGTDYTGFYAEWPPGAIIAVLFLVVTGLAVLLMEDDD